MKVAHLPISLFALCSTWIVLGHLRLFKSTENPFQPSCAIFANFSIPRLIWSSCLQPPTIFSQLRSSYFCKIFQCKYYLSFLHKIPSKWALQLHSFLQYLSDPFTQYYVPPLEEIIFTFTPSFCIIIIQFFIMFITYNYH